MRHGEIHNHGMQTRHGESVEFLGPDGKTVYQGPIASVTETVSETWCDHCKTWVKTNGVLGPIRFMAEHRDGDCLKKANT